MNKRDAKRLALYITGHWMRATDTTGLPDDAVALLSLDDMERMQHAITDLGIEMINRSGLTEASALEMINRAAGKRP